MARNPVLTALRLALDDVGAWQVSADRLAQALASRGVLSITRAATGEMVCAGAHEILPYAERTVDYERAVEQACDVWDAMWQEAFDALAMGVA